jgi:beta-lactamase superfamily II metal-dependent hydrolase
MKRILLYSLIIFAFKIDAAEFVVFNVGQGNCNLFIPDQTSLGTAGVGIPVLFDAGSDHYPETLSGVKIDKDVVVDEIISTTEAEIKKITQNITASLPSVGKVVLNVVVSHAHTDHYSYILTILSKLPKTVIYNFYFGGSEAQYPKKFMDEIRKMPPARRSIFYFADNPAKSSPAIGVSYDCEYLSWLVDSDKNASSLVLKISRSAPNVNPFSILLLGDATGKTTDAIDSLKVKDATLLVANHHGSGTDGSNSDKWISASTPKIVVFSASKSNHGHPDKSVVKRYLDSTSTIIWPIHEFSYSGELLNVPPHFVTYHTEPESHKKRQYFRAINRKALFNTMNEGTLRFKFSAGITIEQPQAYFSMFPLRHITNFLLVDVNITNDEYLQIVPKLHLLAMLTRVDFSKNKLRIKDAADNEMVVSTKALLDAITSIITIELVGNDINSSYIATTMNSEQLKKLKIAAEK